MRDAPPIEEMEVAADGTDDALEGEDDDAEETEEEEEAVGEEEEARDPSRIDTAEQHTMVVTGPSTCMLNCCEEP